MVCLALIAATHAQAARDRSENPAEVVTTHATERYHPNIRTLLDHLSQVAVPSSRRSDREHVGAIFQRHDGFYTASHGAAPNGRDEVSFRVPRLSGHTLVAYWHTHGRDGWFRDRFSETDARLVQRTGRPFYLFTPGGDIRVLAPGALRHGRASGRRSLLGRGAQGYGGALVRRF